MMNKWLAIGLLIFAMIGGGIGFLLWKVFGGEPPQTSAAESPQERIAPCAQRIIQKVRTVM